MKLEVGISSSKFSAFAMWQDSDNSTHTLQVFTLKLWTTITAQTVHVVHRMTTVG